MPGPQIKNWDMYHALRRKGMPKTAAAKITNAASTKKRKKTRSTKKKRTTRKK